MSETSFAPTYSVTWEDTVTRERFTHDYYTERDARNAITSVESFDNTRVVSHSDNVTR